MDYKVIKQELSRSDVSLVAVSKMHPVEMIQELYAYGHRDFGENKVQELVEKAGQLPKDIRWHMIGHCQRNKVKYIAPFIHMIHSVDSLKLLREINKEAAKAERVIPCLLQIKIAEEDTKYGFAPEEVKSLLASETYSSFQHIKIAGLMGMATNTENTTQVRMEFKRLQHLFQELKATFFKSDNGFKEISMGMSGDYKIAIEEGSTMVRIGSLLFGERVYA